MGRPKSGPGASRRASAASFCFASASARSAVRVTIALTFGFTCSICARCARTTSMTDTWRRRMRSANSTAVRKQRSFMALMWRNATDRRRDRAETVGAGVRSILPRALGGESLIAVEVDPPTPWTHGRVHLSAPAGYRRLVDEVCLDVAQRLPLAYDLVIH